MTAVDETSLDALLVRLVDITVHYRARRGTMKRAEDVVAVDGVSLVLERGRTLGIVGSTGSGKTTLAQVIMGLVQPTSGSVHVGGFDLAQVRGEQRRRLEVLRQIVFQDPYSSLDPRMRVADIVAEPLTLGRAGIRPAERRRIRARVDEVLTLVGLAPNKASLYPHQFSGGQRQRISIARALAPEPELIILDEPTSSLDVSVRAQILNLLKDLQEQLGVTYLVISHDLLTVSYLASTVAVMDRGRVVESGATRSVFGAPRHQYTADLIASTPTLDGAFLTDDPQVRPTEE